MNDPRRFDRASRPPALTVVEGPTPPLVRACYRCGTDEVKLHKFLAHPGLWCWACIEAVHDWPD